MKVNQLFYSCQVILLILIFRSITFGQSVSVNSTGNPADAQSILDISATDKGVLLPRMTTAQRTIFSPTNGSDNGMLVYDTDTESFWYWDGTVNTWREIPNTTGLITTLDGAYDGGGLGVGRVITADAGAVDIQGIGGLTVNGNVGVGNTNSDYKLQVSGGSGGVETTLLNLHSNSSTDETGTILRFTNSTSTTSSPGSGEIAVRRTNRDATGDAAMFFRTSNGSGSPADRMTILDNGNVGIGTTAPDYELDVAGDIGVNQYITHNGNTDTELEFNSDQITLWAGGISMVDLTEVAGTDKVTINATTTDVDFNVHGNTDANLLYTDASTNRVGIGTSTPDYKLDVVGDVNLSNAIRIAGNAGTSGYVLTSSGGGVMTWQPSYNGDITSVVAGAGLVGGGTTGDVTVDARANNGLNVDATADHIQLGGVLTEPTTISLSAFDMTYDLNSTGNFVIQDGGVPHFQIDNNDGNAFLGADLIIRDGSTTGTTLVDFTDAGVGGNDGRIQVYTDGLINHIIHGDGDVIFNDQGIDRDFRIESDNETNVFRVDAGTDRIGIGIGTPTAQLHTTGTLRFANYTNGFLQVDGSGNVAAVSGASLFTAGTGLSWSGTTLNSVWTRSVNEIYNNNSANVGIGTTSPSEKLHVQVSEGSGNSFPLLVRNFGASNNNGSGAGIGFNVHNGLPLAKTAIYNERLGDFGAPSKLHFLMNSTADDGTEVSLSDARMTILSTGNVGVGTSAPAARLHLAANANGGLLIGQYNDQLGWNGTGTAPELAIRFAGYRDVVSNFAGAKISAIRTNICCSGLSQGMELAFFTQESTAGGGGDSNLSEKVRIGNGGNLGVGTTTPSQKLHVVGNARISGLSAGGNVQANASGDLIISNDVPSGDGDYIQNQYSAQQSSSEYWISGRGRMDGGLTVGAGGTIDNNNTNTGTVSAGALAFGNASGEGIGSKRSAGGNQFGLDFYTQSANRMVITNGGNVGIGTTGPGAQLALADVGTAGYKNLMIGDDTYFTDIDATDFLGLYSNVNPDRAGLRLGSDGSYLFGDGGNIGIGTTSPNATLNVIHPTTNTSPTAPGGFWAALIENRYDANDGRHGLSVATRWGSPTSKVFEAASYWTGGAQAYTPILTVFGNRTVGIGNSNPQAVLHVSGSGTNTTVAYGYLNSSGSTGTCGSCNVAYTIQADGRIRSTEFNAISDNRIKNVVDKTSTEQLLNTVNRLEVTKYEYIDQVANGSNAKEGFIAQQVEEVVPSAIKISTDFIPNIYALATKAIASEDNDILEVKLEKPHHLAVGDEVKLITESGEKTASVSSIPDEKSFTVNEWPHEVNQVFVYGKKVSDFRAVDYDQIFSIGIGAIQELSKENDALKAEVESLKSQINELNGLKAEIERVKGFLQMDAVGDLKE